MTQLMGRPIVEVPQELGTRPVLADMLTGVRTALLGLAVVAVPVLGLWVVTPYADDGAAGAVRLAGALWLLGHGAPVLRGAADAPLTATPLLLGLLAVGQLYRAGGRVAARRGLRSRWGGPSALWCGYCAVAVAVVLHCSGAGLFRSRVLPDVLAVTALAAAATAAGARTADRAAGVRPPARSAGWPVSWWRAGRRVLDRAPAWARPDGGAAVVRTAALAGGAGLLAAGAAVVAVAAVLAAVAGAGPATAAFGYGPVAVVGLLLLSVVLLPNAVLWAAAYALGPGFAVGAGTLVAPAGAVLGPVPEFPLFALVAEPGAGGWRWAACALPALAGVVPALLLGRRAAEGPEAVAGSGATEGSGTAEGPEGAEGTAEDVGGTAGAPGPAGPWHPVATVVAVLAAALLLGAAAAVLAGFSGGALAAGRMAELGPVPWRTGLAAAGWFEVVAGPGALLVRALALAGAVDRTAGGREAGGRAAGTAAADGGAVGAAGAVGAVGAALAGTAAVGGALAGRARRGALLLRTGAYALVLRLGGPPDGAAATDPDPDSAPAPAPGGGRSASRSSS
ncbi:DUF6350 family protein [Kitasatospora sp. NBC_01560]|uniref:cell division protein PerM n=1 Tax=Kitasatospora sp. NBC_01560 TaxID=2975965 RepID=UPI00386CB563